MVNPHAVSGHQNVISYNARAATARALSAVSGHQNVISYNQEIGSSGQEMLCLDIKT